MRNKECGLVQSAATHKCSAEMAVSNLDTALVIKGKACSRQRFVDDGFVISWA